MFASWDGSAWNIQTAVSNSNYGYPTLALDSHNYPHIEFFNGSLMYVSWTGAKWNIQTVAPNNFAYGEGPLALDSDGNPNICYWVDNIHNTTAFVSSLIYTTTTEYTAIVPSPSQLPTSPNTAFIIVGAAVAVAIAASAVFLAVKKRLKSKKTNPQ